MEAALVLVCKRPMPGVGKQRIAASIGIKRAQQVAQALLDCALEDMHAWEGPLIISPASSQDRTWADNLLPSRTQVSVHPQITGNLGQRLNELDRTLRMSGLKRLIYIGSDAPLLTNIDYSACREALHHHETVLIPAFDGGVALMASNTPWPELSHLPWSTDQLEEELTNLCLRTGQTVIRLNPSLDVDELENLEQLVTLLKDDPRPARRQLHALAHRIKSGKQTQ
jgi:uncharacterized protein